mmetsp:Transcript_34560/g.80071  ORF Transcript_34560/g.80071 Transcript_34560/m.80071 type:complete len:359 (-) Transcript_34560:101-1177(-)
MPLPFPTGNFGDYPPDAPGDHAVICRKNAPLVLLQFALARRGIRCVLLGRADLASAMNKEIDIAIEKYVGTPAPDDTEDVEDRVEGALLKLKRHLETRESELDEDHQDSTLENRRDMIDCVLAIIQEIRASPDTNPVQVQVLREFVTQLGKPKEEDMPGAKVIQLSTVHKAKGLEWERVYILQPDDLPLRHVMDWGERWQRAEEIHCAYVAYTRSVNELILLRHLELGKDRAPADMDPLWEATGTMEGRGAEAAGDEAAEDFMDTEIVPPVVAAACIHFGLEVPDISVSTQEELTVGFLRRVKSIAKKMLLQSHPDVQARNKDGQGRTKAEAHEESAKINNSRGDLEDWVNALARRGH